MSSSVYIEIITWLLSYLAPYHPEESGINPRGDAGLDMKVIMS